MIDREKLGQEAFEFSETLWQRGDFWELETSEFELARCDQLFDALQDGRYARALELGCGAGYFTRLLAPLAEQVVAFDISPSAIARARSRTSPQAAIDFRVGNIMDYGWRAEGPWDLVVMNDTICYLGWLYPFFDIAWLARELHAATRSGGRFLMANTMDPLYDKLLLPHIIRTYRDLFANAGFRIDREEGFRGTKHGVDFEVLITRFGRP